MPVPELKTRRPSGKPPHPLLLIAGVEKAGKSYSGAAFSASDLVDRTFWIEIGEGAADQYGAIPGARYEIVEHDGTYRSIEQAVDAATHQPRENGRPHAVVIDSITELWDLLSDQAQLKANARAKAKAEKANRPIPAEDVQITMDLWNDAKKKWRRVLELLRTYDGPVILLARLEMVSVMGADGKPTTDREWKIRAEKNLPYECDAIVKMTAPQQAVLTGVRSTVLQVPPGRELPLPQFTIDELLRRMGLDGQGATAPRSYTPPKPTLDEVPDAPMQRQPPRSDDEWTTPAGPPEATGQQLGNIADGLRIVRGIDEPAAMLAAVSEIVKRQITAPEQLNRVEAERVLSALRAEDEARRTEQQVKPEPEPTPDPAQPKLASGHQLTAVNTILGKQGITDRNAKLAWLGQRFGRPLGSTKDLTAAEASALIDEASQPGPAPQWTPLVDDLAAAMRAAATSDELADVSEQMWRKHEAGMLSQADVSKLQDISLECESQLAQAVAA